MTQLGNVALQCRLRERGWCNGPSPVTVGLEHRPSRWFMQQIRNVWNVLIVKVLIVTWRMWRSPGSARMLTDTTQRMHIRKKKNKKTRELKDRVILFYLTGVGNFITKVIFHPKWTTDIQLFSFPHFLSSSCLFSLKYLWNPIMLGTLW